MGWFPARPARPRARRAPDRDPDRRRGRGRGTAVARIGRSARGLRSSSSAARASAARSSPQRSSATRRRRRRRDRRRDAADARPAHVAARPRLGLLPDRADRDHGLRGPVPPRAPRRLRALGRRAPRRHQRARDRCAHRRRDAGRTAIGARLAPDPLDRRLPRCRNGGRRSARRCAARCPHSGARCRGRASRWPGTGWRSSPQRSPRARGRVGAAIGFQQTLLGLFVAGSPPAFAAIATGSWRLAFALSAVGPCSACSRYGSCPSLGIGTGRAKTRNVGDPAGSSLNSGFTHRARPRDA